MVAWVCRVARLGRQKTWKEHVANSFVAGRTVVVWKGPPRRTWNDQRLVQWLFDSCCCCCCCCCWRRRRRSCLSCCLLLVSHEIAVDSRAILPTTASVQLLLLLMLMGLLLLVPSPSFRHRHRLHRHFLPIDHHGQGSLNSQDLCWPYYDTAAPPEDCCWRWKLL